MSSVELTATVSEGGGLGSYGLYGYEPERIERTEAALRARRAKPFALNLWLPVPGRPDPSPSPEEYAAYPGGPAGMKKPPRVEAARGSQWLRPASIR
ncbi:hypothetical protein [Microbacterium sp. 18062]|uniref:hypothetical protein n=1 Tax=Microbacterium sp. 18062 TaxID=2681410 RepID=UPI00135B7DC4|nr:hypothetical protein [Microbacterium sp. 18062]